MFRTLPALHELLPDATRAGGPDLFEATNWPDDALRPERRLLQDAAAARRRCLAEDRRCLHIVGVRQETVVGLERHGTDFHYHLSRDGDGTVPRVLAELPGSRMWYAIEKHGGLPNNGRVISAVVDLLRSGTTDRLPASLPRVRRPATRVVSEAALRRVAPHKVRWQDLSPTRVSLSRIPPETEIFFTVFPEKSAMAVTGQTLILHLLARQALTRPNGTTR